mmetsp:Transcript_18229/g.59631  ORF Transcript_18229/g.59631 Transcript_18229/m.59631 type:complete len:707 (+) Transcript_18229:34-2154(+)
MAEEVDTVSKADEEAGLKFVRSSSEVEVVNELLEKAKVLLRDYQYTVVIHVLKHWQDAEPICLPAAVELPTGSGKSRPIALLAALLVAIGMRVLIIVPNLEVKTELCKVAREWVNIARVKTLQFKSQSTNTSDENCISDLKNCLHPGKPACVIGNYHTFAEGTTLKIKREEGDDMEFDAILVDEAHHRAASSYNTIFKCFRPKFVALFSATLVRSDKREIKYKLVFERRLAWAIKNRYVKTPSVVPVEIAGGNVDLLGDSMGVSVNGDDTDEESVVDEQGANTDASPRIKEALAEQDKGVAHVAISGLQRLRSYDRNYVMLVKAKSCAHAQNLIVQYRSKNISGKRFRVELYHSRVGTEEGRKQTLKRFEVGELDALIVVSKLGEGYNHPRIAVLALHCKLVHNAAYQLAGRILRLTTDKQPPELEHCTIVVPKLFKMNDIWQDLGIVIGDCAKVPIKQTNNGEVHVSDSSEEDDGDQLGQAPAGLEQASALVAASPAKQPKPSQEKRGGPPSEEERAAAKRKQCRTPSDEEREERKRQRCEKSRAARAADDACIQRGLAAHNLFNNRDWRSTLARLDDRCERSRRGDATVCSWIDANAAARLSSHYGEDTVHKAFERLRDVEWQEDWLRHLYRCAVADLADGGGGRANRVEAAEAAASQWRQAVKTSEVLRWALESSAAMGRMEAKFVLTKVQNTPLFDKVELFD